MKHLAFLVIYYYSLFKKNAQIQPICFWPTQLMLVVLCFPILELHGPWRTTCKLSCVIGCEAKDGAISLYSITWRYEESPQKMKKWKFYMVSCKWIMFGDLWGIVRSMTKRGILHISWGHANRLNCHWFEKNYVAMVGTRAWKYFAVSQHGPFPFHIELKAPLVAKVDLHFPRYDLWMIFKGPQNFAVMALGLYVSPKSCFVLIAYFKKTPWGLDSHCSPTWR